MYSDSQSIRGRIARHLSVYCTLFLVGFGANPSFAAPKDEVQELYQEGVVAYEDIDFDLARTSFEKALVIVARNPGQVPLPLVAQIHIRVGILYIAVDQDKEKGLTSFTTALKLDANVTIDPILSNPQIDGILLEAKKSLPAPKTPTGLLVLRHKPLRETPQNTPLLIRVELPLGMKAEQVTVHYRISEASKFSTFPLQFFENNLYRANLPGTKITGKFIEYYISAQDKDGQPLGLSGALDAPHFVKILASQLPADANNPTLIDKGQTPNPTSTDRSFAFFLRIGGASGTVTGVTNRELALNGAGISLPEIIVEPEVAIYLDQKTTLGLVGNLQLTGKSGDEAGSKTPAAGGAVRVRYFYGTGQGSTRPYFTGEGGFGKVIQRFKAVAGGTDLGNDSDTDIGPSLGVGWGLESDISNSLSFTFDGTARGYFDLRDSLPIAQLILSLGIRLGN